MPNVTETPPPLGPAYAAYRALWDRRAPEELRTLARIKRFCERLVGDPAFRAELDEALDDLPGFAARHGIDIDLERMRPLFQSGYAQFRFNPNDRRWPLASLWDDYLTDMMGFRDTLTATSATAAIHPRFHAWRERQIKRLISELGAAATSITHPLVAYELSRGCSVGCWFCGLSAERFDGHFAFTPENQALWRGVLAAMVARFGAAAQSGFCYWSTDPSDNPDYAQFIAAHAEITGCLPQTTTAAALKNPALTRSVMALFDQHRCVPNRFSILTTRTLRQVHAEFTPDELLGVELVLQNKGALTAKAQAGRVLTRDRAQAERMSSECEDADVTEDDTGGTIACVSGFLINMLDRSIRLVSPTRASKRWPDGFKLWGEASFNSVAEFGAAIDQLVEHAMPAGLDRAGRAAFRPDLACEDRPDGLCLTSRHYIHEVTARGALRPVVERLRSGTSTIGEVLEQTSILDFCETLDFLEQIHAAGLLDDEERMVEIKPEQSTRVSA